MQNNTSSHTAKNSKEYRQHVGFSGGRVIEWPSCLNSIENLWSVLKRHVYQDGRQFSSRIALCDAVADAAHSRTQEDTITNSMDQRVRKVIACERSYIKHWEFYIITP